jgi:hypothetical protein
VSRPCFYLPCYTYNSSLASVDRITAPLGRFVINSVILAIVWCGMNILNLIARKELNSYD